MSKLMKKLSALLILGALSVPLASCGTSDDDQPSSDTSTSAQPGQSSSESGEGGGGSGASSSEEPVTPTIVFDTQGGSEIASITGTDGQNPLIMAYKLSMRIGQERLVRPVITGDTSHNLRQMLLLKLLLKHVVKTWVLLITPLMESNIIKQAMNIIVMTSLSGIGPLKVKTFTN